MSKDILIKNFSLGGYRSFGTPIQKFPRFSKINLLIGQNNSGKSNVLRYIAYVYPKLGLREPLNLTQLDRHFPNTVQFRTGVCVSTVVDERTNSRADFLEFANSKFGVDDQQHGLSSIVLSLFLEKAKDEKSDVVWFEFGEDKKFVPEGWDTPFSKINDHQLQKLWGKLTNKSGGGRTQHWYPETLRSLVPQWNSLPVVMIPAIRKIGSKGSVSEEFSGEGIIERLAKLQNPDVHNQADRERFESINEFLKSVTDNSSAKIEIPYTRDTIVVHMDGRALPLESLGTGIHEVIILAAAATILQDTVVCMEEPELHLNPMLQKKLVRYLSEHTTNQYFITTHSAALMDTPGAEIYHVQLMAGQSAVDRVTSDQRKSTVCNDLGYHPSDLLQANCIVWVEGPSDRIYLNHWISIREPELKEGIHYSIMFYGGKLASHLTGNDIYNEVNDFISLRRLNRNSAIVIDSDREEEGDEINATKERLVEEFTNGPGFAWVTAGREIENYLRETDVRAALSKVAPNARPATKFGQYEKVLTVRTDKADQEGKQRKETCQAPKVAVARYVVENTQVDEGVLDLQDRLDQLIEFIKHSNPPVYVKKYSRPSVAEAGSDGHDFRGI